MKYMLVNTTTVQTRGDVPATTNGPFAEASAQMSAYYLVECTTPERAQALAARILDPHVSAVEVRSVHDTVDPGQ